MHAENVIATPIQLRPAQYLSPREQHLLFEAVEARLRGLPTLAFCGHSTKCITTLNLGYHHANTCSPQIFRGQKTSVQCGLATDAVHGSKLTSFRSVSDLSIDRRWFFTVR